MSSTGRLVNSLSGKPFIKETWADGIDKNGRPIRSRKVLAQNRWVESSRCRVRKAAQTSILHLTARKPDSSICPSGTTTKAFSGKQPYNLGGSRHIYTGGGWWPGFGETGPPADWPARSCPPALPAQKGVWLRITRRRPKDTVRSEPSIRRPVRRSGTSRWSTTPSAACSPRPAAWCSGVAWMGTSWPSMRQTGKPLWHAYLGGANASGPISYAVNGKQYIVGTGAA